MRRIIILFALLLMLRPALAVAAEGKHWYDDHERGWFWYEIEPEPPPEDEPNPELVPPPQQASVPTAPKPQGPPVLSAEWIRDNLEKYEHLAIDKPTPQNVAAFMYLQRVMLDKSQRFAEQVKHVVQMDPMLDQGTRRPTSSYGGSEFSKEARAARQRLLSQVAQQAGIFFFFQGNCGHCDIQAPVLKSIQERYDFVVFPISIDGRPLKNNLFPKFVLDRGQARYLHVIQTPAMFLGKPNTHNIIPLGQNSMSMDQLEERILVAARDAGWISPEDYNSTRGFNASLALDLKPGEIPANLKEQDLIAYIKKLYSERLGGGAAAGGEIPGTEKPCDECALGTGATQFK